jgi:acylphosphatase
MTSRSARITVTGLVQGVGYRYFCRHHAKELGLTGWVKNMPDRSVALQVEGETPALEEFIDMLRQGPSGAKVTAVNVEFGEYVGQFHLFDVTG